MHQSITSISVREQIRRRVPMQQPLLQAFWLLASLKVVALQSYGSEKEHKTICIRVDQRLIQLNNLPAGYGTGMGDVDCLKENTVNKASTGVLSLQQFVAQEISEAVFQ